MSGDVWSATVDEGVYLCDVGRTGERTATLTVKVAATGEVLLDQSTDLYYGAPFGPDVDDVQRWQQESMAAIEAWEAKT